MCTGLSAEFATGCKFTGVRRRKKTANCSINLVGQRIGQNDKVDENN